MEELENLLFAQLELPHLLDKEKDQTDRTEVVFDAFAKRASWPILIKKEPLLKIYVAMR